MRKLVILSLLIPLLWPASLRAQSGTRVPDLTFVFPSASYDPVRYESGILLSNNWRRLGLEVEVVPMDFTALSRRISTPPWDFHAFISGFVARPERLDPDVLLFRPFHSSQDVPGGTNFMGYRNPEYDRLVEAQRTEIDVRKRREIVFKLQEILARDVPTITLYHPVEVHAYNKEKFRGHVPTIGYGIFNFWTLVQATPLYAVKAHILIDEKTSVSFPLTRMRRVEREFYRFGGEVTLKQLKANARVAGVDKRLMLIEPVEKGHLESSIIG
ncbi:MAG: hypothetical protein RB148_06860, partial [Armatimonadota bacterium]|nr:hypothetical protein [Armatimonadota bacterium]